jgi:hypothetical protein
MLGLFEEADKVHDVGLDELAGLAVFWAFDVVDFDVMVLVEEDVDDVGPDET